MSERARNGRYTDELERLCECGRRKGEHLAEMPHPMEDDSCHAFRKPTSMRSRQLLRLDHAQAVAIFTALRWVDLSNPIVRARSPKLSRAFCAHCQRSAYLSGRVSYSWPFAWKAPLHVVKAHGIDREIVRGALRAAGAPDVFAMLQEVVAA